MAISVAIKVVVDIVVALLWVCTGFVEGALVVLTIQEAIAVVVAVIVADFKIQERQLWRVTGRAKRDEQEGEQYVFHGSLRGGWFATGIGTSSPALRRVAKIVLTFLGVQRGKKVSVRE